MEALVLGARVVQSWADPQLRSWSIAGYCELRRDFRNFRADRIASLELLEEKFEPVPGRTVRDLFEHYENEQRRR